MKDIVQKIYDYSLEDIMSDRFGKYSKYIIQDRAIPDVRDGLKPVQRRILYAMYKMRLTNDKPYVKSARSVGETMGKYHPHGDTSIYDAMVRMSQSWKNNHILLDMRGNNGSIDGDSAAASRYTEARLAKISNELLRDIDKDTVKWAPNYDDKFLEPTVLPARFPNLLVNGATGISAGYATNIPPHNLGEVIDATIKLIDDENASLDEIMQLVKGPDFPTGGIIEGINGIKDAYEKGRGKIIVKSKVAIETTKGKKQIIITEIPYEVNKSLLVKKIDDIRIDKKIDGIAEVRDESDKDGLRIAIDLKKEADSTLILNYLLKNTELQTSYNFNMVSIVNRRPRLLGIREMLKAYISHQVEVVTRRTIFDLEHAKTRLHIVEGFIKALSILDEVIKTIRASKNKSDAENNLVREFGFTEAQAEAIVTLQLYRLSNTDVTALEEEYKNLNIIIKGLTKILEDKASLMKVIKDELTKIKEEYGKPRITSVKEKITEIKIDTVDLIPKEEVIVVVTKEGYVKRVSKRSYSASEENTLLKEGDYIVGIYEMSTLDTVLLFTDLGNYLYVPVYEIPDSKWKEMGKHISNIISIKSDENIIGSVPVYDFEKEEYITIFTKLGMIKRTKISDYKVTRYSKPMMSIKLKDKDKVASISYGNDSNIIIATSEGYGLWYKSDEVPVIGTKGSGVKSISLKDNDYVVSGNVFEEVDYLVVITDKGTGKRIRINDLEPTTRARRGVLIVREVKTNPHKVLKTFAISSKSNIGIKTSKDIITFKVSEFTIMDRYSTGSSISKTKIKDAFEIALLQGKNDLKDDQKEVEEDSKSNDAYKQLSLLDVDDNLKQVDSLLSNVNDNL
ncbi:MAG TPA: DNA topoisomerase IV subunit A [Mollicutes bacterium]|nr:DNA topoisomerase IV subunit A [Mollicutes bacterium]